MLDGSHREREPRNLVQPNQWEDVYGSALAGIRAAGQRDIEAGWTTQGILISVAIDGTAPGKASSTRHEGAAKWPGMTGEQASA